MVAKAKNAAAAPAPANAQLLLASGNDKKLAELARLAGQLGLSVLSGPQWERGRSPLPEVPENGDTFLANAQLKAFAALRHARACGDAAISVVADDSGLCVDRLDGAPGVHSARFAHDTAAFAQADGNRADIDQANRAKLLASLTDPDIKNRRAHFECCLVLAGPLAAGPGAGEGPDGEPWRAFVGRCEGAILNEARGEGGFGYDALFLSDDLGKSFAEAPDADKHAVSHRGRAMNALQTYLALTAQTATEERPLFLRPIGLLTLQDALKRTLTNELRYADQALEQALAHAPQLGAKERQAVAEMHWHALRRLDHLMLAAMATRGAQRPRTAPDPRQLDAKSAALLGLLTLADLNAHGEPRDPTKKAEVSALDGLAKRSPGSAGSWPATPGQCTTALRAAAFAARELPEVPRHAMQAGFTVAFLTALEVELGREHAALAMRYLSQRAPLTLRANRQRTNAVRLGEELMEDGIATVRVPGLEDALWCVHPARVTQTRAFIEGRLEIQDEGSQRIAAAAAVRPGETVIDWCAGAGGKTLALAAAMRGEGRLIALEPHPDRLSECKRRCERAGVRVDARAIDKTTKPVTDFGDIADAVLVDAPCSSTGALRRNPELRWHLDNDWLDRFAEQQFGILVRASHHVKRGGRLIYATCSLLRRENEDVVSAFLASRDEFDLVSEQRIGPANLQYLRLMPLGSFGPDGFYVAVLRRRPRVHPASRDATDKSAAARPTGRG